MSLNLSLSTSIVNLGWQVVCDTKNTEKSRKLSTKWKIQKIAENSFFETQNQKYIRKSLFLEYFKVKILRLRGGSLMATLPNFQMNHGGSRILNLTYRLDATN